MSKKPNWKEKLSQKAIEFTRIEIMAKMIATIDDNKYPHLTFLTSNFAIDPTHIKWGEFVKGKSKEFVQKRPKQGMLYMNIEFPFKFLQAKAKLERISEQGNDAADFNQLKMFRYNTYMRIFRVFFNDVEKARQMRKIPLWGIVKGILHNLFTSKNKIFEFIRGPDKKIQNKGETVLPKFGMKLFRGSVYPKFISYINPEDGFPIIIPAFQMRALETDVIYLPFTQFKSDLQQIPDDAKVSIFALEMEGMNMMAKGTFTKMGTNRGYVKIEYVYNSMPPKPGQIYPNKPHVEKITHFT